MPAVLKSSVEEIPVDLTLTLPRSKTDTFDVLYQNSEHIYFLAIRNNAVVFSCQIPRDEGLFSKSFFEYDPFTNVETILKVHERLYQQMLSSNPFISINSFFAKTVSKKFQEGLVFEVFTAPTGELAVSFDIRQDIPKDIQLSMDTVALEADKFKEQLEFLKEEIPENAIPTLKAEVDVTDNSLPFIDWVVISTIDGKRNVAEIIERSAIGKLETLLILHRLKEAGIVDL